MMEHIVLDTNCLILSLPPKSRYHKVWEAFVEGRYALCASNEILEEYEEIVSRFWGEEIANYVIEGADGCHSCCVLMHDSAAKDTTVDALPTIVEWFIDNGFTFDVLTSSSFGYHF